MTNRPIWTHSEVKLEEEGMLCHSEVGSRRRRRNRHKLEHVPISKIPSHRHATEEHYPSDARSRRGQKLLLNPLSQRINIGRRETRPCDDFHELTPIIC